MSKTISNLLWNVSRSSILWGGLASTGFYWLIHTGRIESETVRLYFADHPVEYATTIMFFIAMAALVAKAMDTAWQWTLLSRVSLGNVPPGGQPVAECDSLLVLLESLPERMHDTYLVRRLRGGLEHVRRKDAPDTIEDELRYLSEADYARQHSDYALVRVIIWAIPILGFLGTVIGITLAIANLSPDQLKESLEPVTAGLGTAFNTTTLALGLCIAVMFTMFLVERFENRLLDTVDDRAREDLVGRFQQTGTSGDPLLLAVRRMAETVVDATERVVERQAELWKSTIDAASQRWGQMVSSQQQQLDSSLTKSISNGLELHAVKLAEAEQQYADRNREHWSDVQQSLASTSQALTQQQRELVRQGEVLLKVVEATGQVAKLEDTLNHNLHALAGAHNFEDTLLSLSAAIHLLTTCLGNEDKKVSLTDQKNGNQAA